MGEVVTGAVKPVDAAAIRSAFSYDAAFSRNIGWVTEWEQQALRGKRVAIAGLGGVGGVHLTTLTRLGIGAFHIADFDHFELQNFNRQIGATIDTIGRPKVDVLAEMARRINPNLDIVAFDAGVRPDNLDAFLAGVDLFIDGFDFFELDLRRQVFARCAKLNIPAITAAPLGMGTAFLVFKPDGMSFEGYFRLAGLPIERQYVNFLLGLAPRALHRSYLVDPSRVDLAGQRGPSTVAACELCAGVAAVEAIKLLLGRGRVRAAPYYHQFDAYKGKWIVGRLLLGNRNPLQRLKLAVAYRAFAALSHRAAAPAPSAEPTSDLERVLDAARWAPSGDNTQPWRFEITGPDDLVVYLQNPSEDDIYDYRDGEPTLLSGGMLLECMRIAASLEGRGVEWRYEDGTNRRHRISVHLPKDRAISPDLLAPYLWLRSVNRWPYRLKALTEAQKANLAASLSGRLAVVWHENLGERWRFARLGARATAIRLRIPEAFRIHQRVIDWENTQSPAGIPASATGLSATSVRLMRWALRKQSRMDLLNRLLGTSAAALEMDYWPGIASAAFLALAAPAITEAGTPRATALLEAGEAIQRFWLTATRLGLALQPSFAPLIFADYGRRGTAFTTHARARERAESLAAALAAALDPTPIERVLFMGRIGAPGGRPATRSVRLRLRELIIGNRAGAD